MKKTLPEEEFYINQIGVVDDTMFLVCNLCDVGYDSSEETNSHFIKEHQKVINQIDNKCKGNHAFADLR